MLTKNESKTFWDRSGGHPDPYTDQDSEIRLQIPDHILVLAEFAVSECSCFNILTSRYSFLEMENLNLTYGRSNSNTQNTHSRQLI